MSGKFMNVKKIVIPTLTMLLIASQLCGCAAVSQDEMLQMLNNQQAITIEIAEPISQEQGTEIPIEWKELASLTTYDDFRYIFDDTLAITVHGQNGKNGLVYVDLEGNHTNNSTLYYAFMNQKFINKAWNNSDTLKVIAEAAKDQYVDIDSTKDAVIAGYNAYFNLLPDSEPGYANLNSTLTRLEAMSFIFKADTPVQELQPNSKFSDAVGNHDLAIYAQGIADQSFLDYNNLSLDETLANSTITRAEYIYMLIQRYYSEEYSSTTGNESCYTDAKNGGDIASKRKFITTDKETGAVNAPNRWQAYELAYAIQNPDKGLPDDLYKALVVAKNHNIISGTESRWEEGLTKGDAFDILTKVYESLGTITNADRGNSIGEDLSIKAETETIVESNTNGGSMGQLEAPDVISKDFVVEDMVPTTMYLTEAIYSKEGPSAEEFSDSCYLFKGDAVSVVGVVNSYKGKECLWYRANTGEFIPAEYLSTEHVSAETPTTSTKPVVEQSSLGGMSDEDIQAALDAATSGNENSGGGAFFFEDNPDWDGGGNAPDGTGAVWSN